ncbi:MAG: acyl-CoA thioesterase II [Phycisphaerae bacterium]|nr:acyl-CoA thioesterase II [Gemmatimonadaceae bacterium]
MDGPIHDLLGLLDLEPLEVNIYRGVNRDLGASRVYGGQVFAQALVAARRTVDTEREAHSAHGYFILPGDLKAPIVYFVDRLRDGNSFTTRRVTAIQHGQAIFNLSASFHIEEPGLQHQPDMPQVPGPDELKSELELIRDVAGRIPNEHRAAILQERPIDFRPVAPLDFFKPEPREPVRHVWFRALGKLPDDTLTHQAVLAYASDYGLLVTALQPHGIAFRSPGLQLASLDHSVWMHRPFRADEWLLYSVDSPIATGARGFVRGQIFSRSGELVASVAQEGLMRLRTPK